MKAKKSQLTLFIVLGVFIVIVASLIFFLKGYSAKREMQKEVILTQKESERSKPLRTFVEQCLEKQSKDGLLLAGKQGGYTFNTTLQKGLTDIIEGVEYVDFVNSTISGSIIHVPFFVAASSPRFSIPQVEDDAGSIDEQMQAFINNTITDCADFSSFRKQGIYVNSSWHNVSVEISENKINVELDFPLAAEYKKTGQKESIGGFSTIINTRLEQIYSDVVVPVLNDINANPNQHITDTSSWSSLLAGVTVTIDGSDSSYDIVKITDADVNYNVRGEEFSFWFVKDNW